ncbi:MAG: hypothetical protein KF716_26810 [Anaerolineae bacterium]|nr:hypothetical protein [Anaerolineae bacterium]
MPRPPMVSILHNYALVTVYTINFDSTIKNIDVELFMRKILARTFVILLLGVIVLFILLINPDTAWKLAIFWAKLNNVREISTPPADLLSAQARWNANPIKHYRLKIRRIWAIGIPCSQDVEVVGEMVTKTIEDTCTMDSSLQHTLAFGVPLIFGSTISELFAKFRTETTRIVFKEEQSCGTFLGVAITYASEGYPINAKYNWVEPSPDTLGPNTYTSMYGEGFRTVTCMNLILPYELEVQISLQPLP